MLPMPIDTQIKAKPSHTALLFLRGRSQPAGKIASFRPSLIEPHPSVGPQPAEAKRPCEHLPSRQLFHPAPAGPQLSASGRKPPSIRAAQANLITSECGDHRKVYRLSRPDTHRSFIRHRGPTRANKGGVLVSEIGDNGNNCASNLAPCLSQV